LVEVRKNGGLKMRKLLSAVLLFSLLSCGGGGGSGNGKGNVEGSNSYTEPGFTVLLPPTRGNETSYLSVSGLIPKLICSEGVLSPDKVTKEKIHFNGDSFTNCVLAFVSKEGRPIYTALNKVTATSYSAVTLNKDFSLVKFAGQVNLSPAKDENFNGIVDELEGKVILDSVKDGSLYRKTIIVVFEGDDLGNSSLTEFLKENYNSLVEGVKNVTSPDIRFVVIWDGDKKNGLDGNSDVFILDPSLGKPFEELDEDIEKILSGSSVNSFSEDGILYWFASSDNLSNHLKELISLAVKFFPARSYDLIISDHGDGWVSYPSPTGRTVIFESFSDARSEGITWLGTKQFVEEVLKPLSDEGIHFDLLGFDECLMGEFTSLVLMKDYAKVIVASPEYERAEGWGNVWELLPSWYSSEENSWTIAKKIVDGYRRYYEENPPYVPLAYSQTIGLTAVKTEALESLHSSFEQFFKAVNEALLQEKNGFYEFVVNLYSEGNGLYFYFPFIEDDFLCSSEITIENENLPVELNGENEEVENTSILDISNDIAFELCSSVDPFAAANYPLDEGNIPPTYHFEYGGTDYSGLGYDLLYTVVRIGYLARLQQLGISSNLLHTFMPNYGEKVPRLAKEFLDTYRSLVSDDKLYSQYLILELGNGEVDTNITGSGLSLVYPYTSTDYARTPKLNLCSYWNFVDSYSSIFPNYTSFVKNVYSVLWKALGDAFDGFIEVTDANGKKFFGYKESYSCEGEYCGWLAEVTYFLNVCDSTGSLIYLSVFKDDNVYLGGNSDLLVGSYQEVVKELGDLTEDEIYEKMKNSGN